MADKKTKVSERGQNRDLRVDVAALSPVARRQMVRTVPVGAFTQNTTTKFSVGPVGVPATLKAAYYSARTLPIGGALTITIVAYDASADGEVVLTSALNPEVAAQTAREGGAFTLAATNVALAAADTIELHVAADNNAVGTAQVDGYVTLVWEPTEDTTIEDN